MSSLFNSIEIRKAKNGYVIVVSADDETEEFVYDSPRKVTKFVKEFMDVAGNKRSKVAVDADDE